MRAPLVVGVACVAGGIAIGAQRSVSPGDGPFLVGLALLAALVAWQQARPMAAPGGGRDVRLLLVLLLVVGGLLGMAARARVDRSCKARLPAGVPLTVEGRVVGGSGDRLRLEVETVELGGRLATCRGAVVARADPVPPGSRVKGRGRWWRPPGRTAGLGTGGLLLLDHLEVLPPPTTGSQRDRAGAWHRWIGRLRSGARARVDGLFGDRASLAASLLLAQRDGLDRDVRDRFARAGLSHLLAISGLHVALVAAILLILAGAIRLGRPGASLAAALGTLGYVVFLGAPYSATRAALQILLVLAARAIQRPARTEALIAAAALVLLATDPGALYSPGFQLSFAGVAGILAFRRPMLRRLGWLSGLRAGRVAAGRWLADGLATSVAATVATAPIVAWHFGRVAPVGIVANLVAIPLLSVAVPALAGALVVGVAWLPAGRFLAGAGTLLLDALDATARVAAGVPGGTVAVAPATALVLTTATTAGFLASRRLGRARAPIRGLVWSAVAAAVLLVAPLRPAVDGVEIHVIDVGQGDAIALRSPAGRWVLVDAGVATDRWDAGARLVVPYLGRRGVRRLEGLIITHPDADHMGGAAAVLHAFRPRWVADPGVSAPKEDYLTLLRAAEGAGVAWIVLRRGTELEMDGMVLDVLHPNGASSSMEANDASIVMRVVFGDFQALLTGDAPIAVERNLVARFPDRLEADVLKVGHHGSATSTSPELLSATGARTAVISVGRENRYGHPHRTVLARLSGAGIRVGRTDRHGTLVIRGTSAGHVTMEGENGRIPP